MKRILTITTATLALGALAACGNETNTAYDTENDSTQMTETETANPNSDYGTTDAGENTTAADMTTEPALRSEQRAELEQRLADSEESTIEYDGRTYLSYAALNARDLTGADVLGVDGEQVATVDDIIVNGNGQAEQILLSHGGVFGLGDTQATVDFDQVEIAFADKNDPRISTSLTEEAIENGAEFNVDELPEGMIMASSMLGQEVELGTPEDTASIYDLIMNNSGKTEYVVLSTGLGSDRYLVSFSSLQPGTDEDTWMVSMTPERLETETRIVYF